MLTQRKVPTNIAIELVCCSGEGFTTKCLFKRLQIYPAFCFSLLCSDYRLAFDRQQTAYEALVVHTSFTREEAWASSPVQEDKAATRSQEYPLLDYQAQKALAILAQLSVY